MRLLHKQDDVWLLTNKWLAQQKEQIANKQTRQQGDLQKMLKMQISRLGHLEAHVMPEEKATVRAWLWTEKVEKCKTARCGKS